MDTGTFVVYILLASHIPTEFCTHSKPTLWVPRLFIHSFIYWLIYTLDKCLPRAYHMPGAAEGFGDLAVNKTSLLFS